MNPVSKPAALNLACAALVAFATVAQGARAAPRAVPGAIVEAVQMPAWVERNDERIPLAPGMALRDRDRVRSGANSRILLRMAEGSAVKLGENASLVLDGMRVLPEHSLFRAAMNVAAGAFRFTTDILAKYSGRREVDIAIATVTAGIRGTDLWGKAASDRDIVCLLEGRIQVQRGAEPAFVMDQPMSFYVAPKNAPPAPVAPVPEEQMKIWAAETEIQPGKGAARRGGTWKVVVATTEDQSDALRAYDALRGAGYAADIEADRVADKSVYRVRLSHLPSRAEAQALADSLRGRMGISEPTVRR